MRIIRYAVSMSLDGYIAGPNGEADWISIDPEVDFAAIWAQFDTLLMGRRTYEASAKRLGEKAFKGLHVRASRDAWLNSSSWRNDRFPNG